MAIVSDTLSNHLGTNFNRREVTKLLRPGNIGSRRQGDNERKSDSNATPRHGSVLIEKASNRVTLSALVQSATLPALVKVRSVTVNRSLPSNEMLNVSRRLSSPAYARYRRRSTDRSWPGLQRTERVAEMRSSRSRQRQKGHVAETGLWILAWTHLIARAVRRRSPRSRRPARHGCSPTPAPQGICASIVFRRRLTTGFGIAAPDQRELADPVRGHSATPKASCSTTPAREQASNV